METIAGINRGIAHYLTAKVKASLILAVPVFVVLFVFRTPVRPGVGGAHVLLQLRPVSGVGRRVHPANAVRPDSIRVRVGSSLTIAILLLAIHSLSASVIEPAVIGKAVGLSPVVILFALAFWGYFWGLTGMLLAVPLTVMLKIVCEHLDATRPLAKLVSDE